MNKRCFKRIFEIIVYKKYVMMLKDKRKPIISLEQLLKDESNYKRKNRKNFIGPSTISLEMKHVVPTDNKNIPNINNLYTNY